MHTLQEPVGPEVSSVRLLTYVLRYDDLLAEVSQLFFADDLGWPLQIGRGEDDEPVGRRGSRRLELPDRFLSSRHAVLEMRGEAIELQDAGSRNGTFVNGARVSRAVLADGDLIEVGHSLLCYRVLAQPSAELLGTCAAAPRLGPTRTFCPEVVTQILNLRRIARSRESVLILAETGSGKEVAAAMVHQLSGRTGACRIVDCGAVPESLFESAFFGHQRGAFTGATEARIGEIQAAHGGTLFLDEVGNLPPAAQAKLLRVIEDDKVTPVGATQPVPIDVRWIAATNRDLFACGGEFRSDLLRRLAGYVMRIPPLRRRREDLGALTGQLLREAGVPRAAITPAAGRLLFASDFPGNVRQLRTVLRSAALLAGEAPIDLPHLDRPSLRAGSSDTPSPKERAADAARPATRARSAPAPASSSASSAHSTMPDSAEIEAALFSARGNVMQAARQLKTHARQLYRWIERLALPLDKYRA
ncbi:MAG: sigma 54-interacting transcriptional regulator [Polyangia bacterium]